MTELGVYILGAMALGLLGAAGIASGNDFVVACAVLSAGLGYLAQHAAAITVHTQASASAATWVNSVGVITSCLAWCAGAGALIL